MANLFIGMGGSGVKTIANLKDQLKSSDPELFKKTRFLLIDTDEKELLNFEKHEKIDLGESNVWQYFSQLQNQEKKAEHEIRFLEWFDRKAISTMINGPLKLGASANRPQGRGAAAMKQIPFKDAINKILTEVNSIANDNNKKNPEESVKVYTCCSVAGGTGSSIYLDLMLMLQNEFQEINTTGGEIQLWSILYMPEIYRQMQTGGEEVKGDYKTNVFAFWKEIDAILKDYYKNVSFSNDGIEDKSNKYDQNVFKPYSVFVPKGDFRWKIFKNSILIDYMTSNDKTLKADEMYSNTANLLKYLSDDKIGATLRSGWDNSTNRLSAYSVSNNEAWINSFSIAGFRALEGPNKYLKQYFKARIKKDVFNALVNIDELDKERSNQHKDVINFLNTEFFPFIDISNDINIDCTSKSNDESITIKLQNEITEFTGLISRKISQGGDDKEILKTSGNDILKLFTQKQENLISEFKTATEGESKKIIELFNSVFIKKAEDIIQKNGVGYLREFISILDNDCITKYWGINKNRLDELSTLESGLGCKNIGLEELIRKIAGEISEAKTIKFIGKDADWFVSELNKLSKAIEIFFNYQLTEFLIKFRMGVYKDLSVGDEGITDIMLNKTIELLKELDKRYCVLDKEYTRELPQTFTELDARVTHIVIPKVSNFVKDVAWVTDNSNKFKEFYEDSTIGISHRRNSQNEKVAIRAKNSEAKMTIEQIIELLYPAEIKTLLSDSIKTKDSKAVAIQLSKFETLLDNYIEEEFFSREDLKILLDSSLTDWCDKYPEDFKNCQIQFSKNTPVFFKSKTVAATTEQNLWLSNNRSLCDRLNGTPVNEFIETSKGEDIAVFVKCQQGISFDDYGQFEYYKLAYDEKKKNNLDSFFPHIHKDFYKEDDLLSFFTRQKNIKIGAETRQTDIDKQNKLTTDFEPFIRSVFLSQFYKELTTQTDEMLKKYLTGTNFTDKDKIKLIKYSEGAKSISFVFNGFKDNWIEKRKQFNIDIVIPIQQIPDVDFKDYLWETKKSFSSLFDTNLESIELNITSLKARKNDFAIKGGDERIAFSNLIMKAKENTDLFFTSNAELNDEEKAQCVQMTNTVINNLKLI
jgi:hypothetical protein